MKLKAIIISVSIFLLSPAVKSGETKSITHSPENVALKIAGAMANKAEVLDKIWNNKSNLKSMAVCYRWSGRESEKCDKFIVLKSGAPKSKILYFPRFYLVEKSKDNILNLLAAGSITINKRGNSDFYKVDVSIEKIFKNKRAADRRSEYTLLYNNIRPIQFDQNTGRVFIYKNRNYTIKIIYPLKVSFSKKLSPSNKCEIDIEKTPETIRKNLIDLKHLIFILSTKIETENDILNIICNTFEDNYECNISDSEGTSTRVILYTPNNTINMFAGVLNSAQNIFVIEKFSVENDDAKCTFSTSKRKTVIPTLDNIPLWRPVSKNWSKNLFKIATSNDFTSLESEKVKTTDNINKPEETKVKNKTVISNLTKEDAKDSASDKPSQPKKKDADKTKKTSHKTKAKNKDKVKKKDKDSDKTKNDDEDKEDEEEQSDTQVPAPFIKRNNAGCSARSGSGAGMLLPLVLAALFIKRKKIKDR